DVPGGRPRMTRIGRMVRRLIRAASARSASSAVPRLLVLPRLQHAQKCLLRDLHLTELFHPLLPLLLLLEELSFAADVAAVTLRGDVLPHGRNRLASNDAA